MLFAYKRTYIYSSIGTYTHIIVDKSASNNPFYIESVDLKFNKEKSISLLHKVSLPMKTIFI